MTIPTPVPGSYWLAEGRLLAGQHPGAATRQRTRQRLEALVAAGIRSFIDLTQDRDGVEPYEDVLREIAQDGALDLRYTRLGVRDMGVPADGVMADVLKTIDLELNEHRPVYVHCLGGIGRTGTVAGCWLIEQGLTAEQALDGIAGLRLGLPGGSARSPETDAQCAVVRAWRPRSERSRADP